MAGREARAAAVLIGSTPSTRAKVHSTAHPLSSAWDSVATLQSGFSGPSRGKRPSWIHVGYCRRLNRSPGFRQ